MNTAHTQSEKTFSVLGSESNTALSSSRFMVGCGRCDDWFHGDCVGLDLAKVREMEEEDQMYVCLKCCEEESKKFETEAPGAAKPEVPTTTEDGKQPPKPRPGTSQAPPPGGGKPAKKVSNQHGNKLFNQPLISVFSHKINLCHLRPQLLHPPH